MEELFQPKVRSNTGLIPWWEGVAPHAVRAWQEEQGGRGTPSSFEDYFAVHRICLECLGHGALMIGWSKPGTETDMAAAEEFGLEQPPLYDVCLACHGTGKMDRSYV